MEVWKIMFLSKWVICRFHVNLPGCMFFLNFRAVCSGWIHPTSYSIVHQPRFFWRGFTLQSYVPNNYTCFKILISLHTVDGWNLAPYISDVSNPVQNGINYQPQLVVPDFFRQQYHNNSFTNCICYFSCNFRDLMMISAVPSRKIWWQSHPWKAWAFLKQKGKRKISFIEVKQNLRVTEIPSKQNLAKYLRWIEVKFNLYHYGITIGF